MYSNNKNTKPFKILIVENNIICKKLYTKIMETNHFLELNIEFDMVGNGFEAVNAYSNSIYDMILMDYKLPGLDGIEATKKIRLLEDRFSRIPIIAITAYASKEFEHKAYEAGIDKCLFKPIEINKLFNTLKKYKDKSFVETLVLV